MTDKIRDFLADNVTSIIAVIFMLGGIATTITMMKVQISDLEKEIEVLKREKVSYAVLDLKEKTLNSTIGEIQTNVSGLQRRLNEGDVKRAKMIAYDLEIETAVHAQRLKQGEAERKDIWKFINKFLEKIK